MTKMNVSNLQDALLPSLILCAVSSSLKVLFWPLTCP